MKRSLFYILALTALVLSSCVNDRTNSGSGGSAAKNGFKLNYKIPGSSVNTYATVDPEQGEEEVHSLYLLFFEPTSGGTGKFIEHIDASPESGYPYTNYGSVEIKFPTGSTLKNSEPYNILLVANLENYIDLSMENWLVTLQDRTENEVVSTFNVNVEGAPGNDESINSQRIRSDHILMSCEAKKGRNETHLDVELVRCVSRFDITNNASGYTLMSASVWNAFPQTSIWNHKYFDFVTPDRIERYYGVQASNNKIIGGLYAFENYVVSPELDDNKTTCVILGVNDGTKTTFYRVNINAKSMGQQLRRNNVYKMEIRNVLGEGAPDEKGAWTSNEMLLDIKINSWDVDEQGTIQYNGDNVLAIPAKHVYFTPKAESRDFTIYAIGEGTLEMTKNLLPTGISANLNGKELTITVTDSEETRTGAIEFYFAGMTATMYVTQTGAKEEYLNLSASDIPVFPNSANAVMNGEIKVMSSGPWTAQIYNENFKFLGTVDPKVKQGDNNDSFIISTNSLNSSIRTHYAFILITLDSNTDISRVILLAQKGTGGIDLFPTGVRSLSFDAFGNAKPSPVTFEVDSDGEDWEIANMGSNPSSFTVVPDSDPNKFTIKASQNTTNGELSATIRVRLQSSHNIYEDIEVTQDAHELTVLPISIDQVGYKGGYTTDIYVTSSTSWTARLEKVTTHGEAYFNSGNQTTISGNSGTMFKVRFERNDIPTNVRYNLVVTLDGTNVTVSREITQQALQSRTLTLTTYRDHYGNLSTPSSSHYYDRIYQFGANMRNTTYFGTTGTCYTMPYSRFYVNNNPNTYSSDIFVVNASNPGTSNGTRIMNWLNEDDCRVLMLFGDIDCLDMFNNLGLSNQYSVRFANVPSSSARTINPSSNYTVDNNKLMEYLLKTGPFTGGTEIPKSSIRLHSYDGSNGALTSWPSGDFIPIILNPGNSNECVFGIDPKRRIIFVGDTEIFGNKGTEGRYNYEGGTYSNNNTKFLNNVIAWMTYAAQYGEYFTSQFEL